AWMGRGRRPPGALDLRIHADQLDTAALRALAPVVFRRTTGRLALDFRLHGPSWNALAADGDGELTGGPIELVATGVSYENVHARVHAAGQTVELRSFDARAGKGTASGEGRLVLSKNDPSALDLRLTLRDFLAVRSADYEGDVSGSVLVRGSLSSPEIVSELDVVRGVLRPAGLPGSGPSLDSDPPITQVDGPPHA